jgi:acetyltransferase-like isoleucine patch superfamily enzyme/transposase
MYNRNWLIQKYNIEKLTSREVAKICGVGKSTILRWLKKFNIKPREQYGFKKFKNKEWLQNALEKHTTKDIARMCKCNRDTIMKWIKNFDIKYKRICTTKTKKIRHNVRIGKKHSDIVKEKIRLSQLGDKGHNWRGGKTDERFKNGWKQQKKKALERDNYTCQRCGKTKKENNNRELDVHHKVPFRCFVDFQEGHRLENLIVLCRKCHLIEESKKTIINSKFGKNPVIWNYVNIYNSNFGDNVKIGSFVEIGGSKIGDNCKIEAHSFIPPGYEIGNDVFWGPGTIGTNDKYPYAANHEFVPEKTIIRNGVSIGANCTILPRVEICVGAAVGAGSVVTKSIRETGTYFGNPAKKYEELNCPKGLKKCVHCGGCDGL